MQRSDPALHISKARHFTCPFGGIKPDVADVSGCHSRAAAVSRGFLSAGVSVQRFQDVDRLSPPAFCI